jgi:hypothetical protein
MSRRRKIIHLTIQPYIASGEFRVQFLLRLALTRRRNRSPQRHSLGAGGLGIPQQRLELMGVQPEDRWFRIGRPPGKAAGGKAFLTQPKTLPVKYEALQRFAPPTRKNHQSTCHRVDFEMLPAHLRQAVYSFPEIHRLDCQPNPHLRGDLDHVPDLQNASAKPTRSNPSLPSQRIVILAPSPRASSTVQFGPRPGWPMSGSSTNPGGGLSRDRRGVLIASARRLSPL